MTSARNSITKRFSQVSFADGIFFNENDHDHEADAGAGVDMEAEADEKIMLEDVLEEGTIVEDGKLDGDGEKDAIDELEHIVDC